MREELQRAAAAAVPDVPDDRSYAAGASAAAELMTVLGREAARGFNSTTTYIGSGKFAQGYEAAATKLLAGLDYEFGEHVYERLASLDGGPLIRERVRTLTVRW
jgi:hypothetical protein